MAIPPEAFLRVHWQACVRQLFYSMIEPLAYLPFSKWEAIFKDAMMTAAAIDRLVHHSVIIELNIPSYRVEHAKKNQQAESQGENG